MSATTTDLQNDTRNRVIADAKSLPDLIAKAQVLDPALAQQLTSKALVASKSVYGPMASLAVSWAVTRWGLGWDDNTCALLSGVVVLGASAAFRAATRSPIGGLFSVTPPTTAPLP